MIDSAGTKYQRFPFKQRTALDHLKALTLQVLNNPYITHFPHPVSLFISS